MAFEVIERPDSARSTVDSERGITIGLAQRPLGGYAAMMQADSLEYSTYTFTKADLQFSFRAASIYTGYAPKIEEYDPDKVTQPYTSTSFVLEDSLREGLERALHRQPTNQEYSEIREIIREGFSALMQKASAEASNRTYQVLFDKNMDSVAKKYPGKMQNYERWAQTPHKAL